MKTYYKQWYKRHLPELLGITKQSRYLVLVPGTSMLRSFSALFLISQSPLCEFPCLTWFISVAILFYDNRYAWRATATAFLLLCSLYSPKSSLKYFSTPLFLPLQIPMHRGYHFSSFKLVNNIITWVYQYSTCYCMIYHNFTLEIIDLLSFSFKCLF